MKLLTNLLNYIKFEHSIFALPFALSGAILSTDSGLPSVKSLVLIILAMISARSFAMSVNRIIDKEIDADNPRTQNRELPQGKVTNIQAIIFTLISIIVLMIIVLQLPKICLILLPVAIIWFYIYPYTKRFTFLSHLWLGIALGASVLAGWIAVTGKIDSLIPFTLGIAVTFWVCGFDIIYACEDYSFDKNNNLKSIPVQFGVKNALLISRLFHILTVIFLIFVGLEIHASYIYWLSVALTASVLYFEQSLVKENDLSKVNMAFFTLNGWVSLLYLIFLILERTI